MFSATPSGSSFSLMDGESGVPFSERMQSFVMTAGAQNVVAPGKRPRITLSPTLVFKNGRPFMSLSTAGGDNQDQALLMVLLYDVETRVITGGADVRRDRYVVGW